uniref:Cytochrome P450 CYP4C77 n=1 Tax=Nilaparvata lugens TaxID=108931 RepID=A0A0K0LBB5_NILLU|nr:cytochrome P450 CYP4C77 [Nilaparvata lugens]
MLPSMDTTTMLIITLGATLLIYIMKLVIERINYIRIIDRIPGPPAYPIVGDSLDVIKPSNKERFDFFSKRAMTYYPMFRTWRGPWAEVHLMRPEHVEIIASSVRHIDKSFGYKFLHPWLGTGLLTSTGNKWHERRKLLSPTFHFKILEDFVEVFCDKSKILVELLDKKADGNEFDIYPFLTLCALDVICETAMGTPVNAQMESDSQYIKAVYEISKLTIERGIRPWLHPNFIFQRTEFGKKYENCLSILHGFTKKVISERRLLKEQEGTKTPESEDFVAFGQKKRKAFLDLLLDVSSDGKVLSDDDIREEVDTFMFEGHDTTTAGMAWTLFLLGNETEIQEKVFQELDSIFGDSDRSPTMQDLGEMKYLERVIKESLRLYPSVPFIGRQLKEDVKIDKYLIPANTLVLLHIYHLHRCEDQFPNPEVFDPDNFLPERTAKRHPYAYLPFSAGPRNCIGQKFALLEEKTILSSILRKFRIEAVEKQKDIILLSELILRPFSGVRIRMYPRK